MTDRKLMQQALEKLEFFSHMKSVLEDTMRLIADLRERLAQPEQEPFCFHDGRNIVGKEYADHSDVFPLYTSPNPEQQKPVRFNCTVIDDAHLNGVPLSQWGKQHEMQPCAGRNCGSTNPNLHSAECFEDYEKATGMNQWQGLTDEEIGLLTTNDKRSHIETPVLALFARAIEAKLKEKNARPIKPLTDEEIATYFQEYINTGSLLSFADGVRFAEAAHGGAIEAKLREKNNAR